MKHTIISLLFLFVLGCSDSGDSSQVRLSIQGNTQVLRRSLTVEMFAPGWTRRITGGEFGTPDAPNYSQSFVTPSSGTLQVQITVADSTGGYLSSGSVSLDIRGDWRWSIDFVLANKDPFYGCFGCVGHKAVRVAPIFQMTPGDSLFVVWGGNSIKHPVIY